MQTNKRILRSNSIKPTDERPNSKQLKEIKQRNNKKHENSSKSTPQNERVLQATIEKMSNGREMEEDKRILKQTNERLNSTINTTKKQVCAVQMNLIDLHEKYYSELNKSIELKTKCCKLYKEIRKLKSKAFCEDLINIE